VGKKYLMDMSKESERMNLFIDPGWYDFEIVKVIEQTSKSGNNMFKVTVALMNDPTMGTDVYLVAEQGKRWFLKQLLKACDCPANEDGVYEWDEEDIIGRTVSGKIENSIEEWIDRAGNPQATERSKIVSFRKRTVDGE